MNKQAIVVLSVALAGGVAVAAPHGKTKDTSTKDQDTTTQIEVTSGRGRLGIRAIEISPELREHLGAPADRGVLVDGVIPDSPAAKAGVQVGDVVLDVDGNATQSASDMREALSDHKKSDVIGVEVQRGSQQLKLSATLDSDPGPIRQSFRGSWNQLSPGDMPFDLFRAPPPQMFGDQGNMRQMLDDLRQRLEKLEQKSGVTSPNSRSRT